MPNIVCEKCGLPEDNTRGPVDFWTDIQMRTHAECADDLIEEMSE